MPNTKLLFLVNKIVAFLPSSGCFSIKVSLYRICGLKISKTARLQNITVIGLNDIIIGEDTFIGGGTLFTGGNGKIKIGNYCDISNRVILATGTHLIDPIGKRMAGEGRCFDIIIGDGVWIGIGSTILPGITIGNNSIVGAGSIVTRNVEAYTIVAGVPAKPIKVWNKEEQIWKAV